MSSPLVSKLVILGAVACAGAFGQQSVSIFHLQDGSAVEGKIVRENKSEVTVESVFGRVMIPKVTLRETRASEPVRRQYEQRAKMLPEKDVDARLMLAEWCLGEGLTSGFADELDRVLARTADSEKCWQLVRAQAPRFEMVKNPHETSKPRWAREQVDLLFEEAADAGLAKAAMLRVQLESLAIDLTLPVALDRIRQGKPMERWIACRILGATKDVRRVKPLYVHAMADPNWHVRFESVDALKRSGDGKIIGPFVKQLLTNENTTIRLFAAEALAQAADKRALPALVQALADANSSGPARSNLAVLPQISYVKDYDVEIAQAAVIADPIVDVIREGVVHDVGLVGVATMRAGIVGALTSLSGQDFGKDHNAWSDWLRANPSAYAAAR